MVIFWVNLLTFAHHYNRTCIHTYMKHSGAFAEFIIVNIEVSSSLVEETVMLLLHIHHYSLSNRNTYACSGKIVSSDFSK